LGTIYCGRHSDFARHWFRRRDDNFVDTVAGDGGHHRRKLLGRFGQRAVEVRGILAIPDQQRAVDMWAIAEDTYAPIILPVGLALMKIRGVDKNAWNVRTTSR
jgi:hypothetical protein